MNVLIKPTTFFAVALLCCLSCVSAYKYLAIVHMPAHSHYFVGSSLLKALALKGHNVTVISPYPMKKPMANFHDIELKLISKIMQEEKDNLLATTNRSVIENISHFHGMGLRITEAVLLEPAVQKLMQSDEKFDAVICEVFLSEALFALSEHFKAPLIGLGTFGAIAWNTDLIGSPSPPSYVPSPMLPFTDHMTFTQRLTNMAYLTFERALLDLWYYPKQEALYKKYFPHLKRSLHDIRTNAALVLLNTHVSISFPRPYVPNQIEVGGMHINSKRTPLPETIENFIRDSEHGVIYFSMGSNLKSNSLPIEKRRILLNTFRGLKQRILWKFEDPNLEDQPDNVFINNWFPQDDILAHPKVRAFITHGGLLSTTESIYHGKPFIGIPIFGDQFLNMARAERNGYGIQVNYADLSVEKLRTAIEHILNNKTYAEKVQQMSERFRDQDMLPLDRAIYWVEHVVRHKGAAYLHCAGLDLNFFQYHNIDVFIALYGSTLVLLATIFIITIRCMLKLCAKKEPKLKRN